MKKKKKEKNVYLEMKMQKQENPSTLYYLYPAVHDVALPLNRFKRLDFKF